MNIFISLRIIQTLPPSPHFEITTGKIVSIDLIEIKLIYSFPTKHQEKIPPAFLAKNLSLKTINSWHNREIQDLHY